jgi:SAM-dependent methyltransferase
MGIRPMDEYRGYQTKITPVTVGGHTFELLCPAVSDELLDRPSIAARFETDAYLPYWAQLWTCGLMLSDKLMEWGRPTGIAPTALEIGCGLGLVTMTMCHLGYRVWASDYDEDALEFLRHNLKRNSLPEAELIFVDWRETFPEMFFDRIVASDILYETNHLRPVARYIYNHLKPQGLAFIADANRSIADDFENVARDLGLTMQSVTPVERIDPEKQKLIQGRVFQLARGQ